MKKMSTKLLSLLLVIALSVSMFTVFAFAEGEDAGNDTSNDTGNDALNASVLYNRDYSDGWNARNGVGYYPKTHSAYIDKEESFDNTTNYFLRVEAGDTSALSSETDGFLELGFTKANPLPQKHAYIEFDIKIDDVCNLGTILYFRCVGGAAGGVLENLLSIEKNTLYVFPDKPQRKSYPILDEWVHVVIDFDYTNPDYDPEKNFDIHITLDDNEPVTRKVAAAVVGNSALSFLRFGLPGLNGDRAKERVGQSYCLDNLKAYCNTNRRLTDAEIDAHGYGLNVDVNANKTEIITGAEDKSTEEHINESLCMKVGVNYALLNGKQVNIIDGTYGAPKIYNDRVVVPFDIILQYIGAGTFIHEDGKSYDISTSTSSTYLTIGRDLATVNGEIVSLTMAPGYYTDELTGEKYAVIALDDVETLLPGYYVTYDDMGLIIIGAVKNLLNRNGDLSTMLGVMKRFIYNYIDAETVYETAKEMTNDFTHPYVFGDQSVYDRLIAIWNGTDTNEYDADIKGAIDSFVEKAYDYYKLFALPDPLLDENGDPVLDKHGNLVNGTTFNEYRGLNWANTSLQQNLVYPYPETNGYDPAGGRQAESGTVTTWAFDIAFGYIITGDIKLAQLAYDMLVEVGEWNHWCPGHFLNTADAARSYAIALDWIYNGIVALGEGEYDGEIPNIDGTAPSEYYDVTYLEKLLYKNGVRMGYLSTTRQHHGWTRPQGDIYYYDTMSNNWGCVCVSGMWIASLVLMGSDNYGQLGPEEGEAPVAATSAWLISSNLRSLAQYGVDAYAPDGSYEEGPGYWGYGTGNLYYGLMALWRCLGDDFGFLDAPGMDKTCYFALHIESSDYYTFNYHDSESSQMDTSTFFFVSEAMNDPVLSEIRRIHITNGKDITIKDLLYYPFDNVNVDVELPLDYYMEVIDGAVTRSSWEKGALFAGIIAGPNGAQHGQIDSGTFVYHNGGVQWLIDLGSDNYNLYGYFAGADDAPYLTRYRYYRMNAEGQNVVALTSQPNTVPYGQVHPNGGEIIDWFSNEYGSYAIIDNTEAYGSYATDAKRGMMLTNNRKTLVIQDEIRLSSVETLYWLAHFDASTISPSIENSGRRMYLYDNMSGKMIRLSIVSNNSYERFTITSAGNTEEDRLLKGDRGTVDYEFSMNHGKMETQRSRDMLKRIAIEVDSNTMNMAVVIEMIESKDDPIGYSKFVPMNEWVPSGKVSNDNIPDTSVPSVDELPRRTNAKLSTISSSVKNIRKHIEMGRQFSSRIEEYYADLSNVYYTYTRFYPDELVDYKTYLDEYEIMKADYDNYRETVNETAKTVKSLTQVLMGV